DVSPRSERDVQTVIRQLQWGAAWLELGRLRNDSAQAAIVRDRLQTVLDLLASTFGHERFTSAAMAFVTAVATRLSADRVTLGLIEVLAALAGPVLDRARRDDRWIGIKILDASRGLLARLFGPRHVGLKVSVALAAAVLIFVSVASGTFRVAANAVLEPVVR